MSERAETVPGAAANQQLDCHGFEVYEDPCVQGIEEIQVRNLLFISTV